jgi:hypothetical protein
VKERTTSSWAYQKRKGGNVILIGGVAQTATRFARYMRKKHQVHSKELRNTQLVTLGSVSGINTVYRPALRVLYGNIAIRETAVGATE